MSNKTVIKLGELDAALAKVLPHFKGHVPHGPIINGIIIDLELLKGANPIDVAGKILHDIPSLAGSGAKPAVLPMADKRIILGFQVEQKLHV